MRIKNSISTSSTSPQHQNTPVGASTVKGSSIFSSALNSQQSSLEKYENEVSFLQQEIEAAGDALTQEPTLPNFIKFRDILSALAKTITNEAYRLEKFGGTPQNPRCYEIIRVINAEADSLYGLIIQSHNKNISITEKVIGIKGLVVDLLT